MSTKITAAIAAGLVSATLGFSAPPAQKQTQQESGVAKAIAFERAKDAADARQARLEAKHPSVQEPAAANLASPGNEANRSTENSTPPPARHKAGDAGPGSVDR